MVAMDYSNMVYTQPIDAIKISLASPEKIREWSYGEVKKPDTINYRTFKPEVGGLFCARIFGPTKDYECMCGKYKRMKNRGVVCEKCGVEVTSTRVRRERMAHIDLAAPVVHVWFLRSTPSRISLLLDVPVKDLERVVAFEACIVSNPGNSGFHYGELITEEIYKKTRIELPGDVFNAGMGPEIIKTMLSEFDLYYQKDLLQVELLENSSETKRKKIIKRMKLIEDFIQSGNRPEWMVLDVLPVIPPELRPLVMLEGGRFAVSDLNELYRRLINRNNRLHKLIQLRAPEIIIRNEKRMLQEAVNVLFDSSKRVKTAKTTVRRPLKSLADMLKGKQGRFRQNLLGKRVDYSARTVISPGPRLKLEQCGLPKRIALELFKPFIYSKLQMYGLAMTLRAAKRMVEEERLEVWDILSEVVKDRCIILNRAPTLHRLGIQAFRPILIEGKTIQLHPLVCVGFNADFDGDQMAAHLPLSIEAQLEARLLMMSTNNILSSANGKPVILPTKEMVLGLYYLTLMLEGKEGEGRAFKDLSEIEHAIHMGALSLHAKIKCRVKMIDENGESKMMLVDTTAGRMIMSELTLHDYPISFEYYNRVIGKKEISQIMELVYKKYGQNATVVFADKVMQLGFKYSTQSGISFGKDDMIMPESREKHISEAAYEVEQYTSQYAEGFITNKERYNKVVDAWSRCADKISADLMAILSGKNKTAGRSIGKDNLSNIYMMADSGARGSSVQIRQLSGMRGLMSKSSGEILELPITSNFREGLNVLQYYISTHGARKGLADTALKTATSGYLTRKLADVAQNCIVLENECNTTDGLSISSVVENGEVVLKLSEIGVGKTVFEDVYHPINGEVMITKNEMLDSDILEKIENLGVDSIKVRSPITCKTKNGICALCYGADLATGRLVDSGSAVGIVAAQSIGEPGTQLTMRTFHVGGAAQKDALQPYVIASHNGVVKFNHKNTIVDSKGRVILMSKNCEVHLYDDAGIVKMRSKLPYGSHLFIYEEGARVEVGNKIAEWDPFFAPVITEKSGYAKFVDLISGVSLQEIQDDVTGAVNKVVVDAKNRAKQHSELYPRIVIEDGNGNVVKLANNSEAQYHIPFGGVINISEGDFVNVGDIIARVNKESFKTRDIIGGLPKIIEIFDARQPKEHAIIAETSGYVAFKKDFKSRKRIIVEDIDNPENVSEYYIPKGYHMIVNEGEYVVKGELLTSGSPSLNDILRVLGIQSLATYMIQEIQQTYRLQGILINDKHIEVIIRQMLQKVEITDPGGTTFIVGEVVDKIECDNTNEDAVLRGLKPAKYAQILQGITRASMQSQSFLSAASFQGTTQILVDSAIKGKVDNLIGLKENVIVGKLLPNGTGFYTNLYKRIASLSMHERQTSSDASDGVVNAGSPILGEEGDVVQEMTAQITQISGAES